MESMIGRDWLLGLEMGLLAIIASEEQGKCEGQSWDFPVTYFLSTFSSPPSLGVQLRQETPGAHGHLPVHVRADFITFCLRKALKSLMRPKCNPCSSAIPSAHVPPAHWVEVKKL